MIDKIFILINVMNPEDCLLRVFLPRCQKEIAAFCFHVGVFLRLKEFKNSYHGKISQRSLVLINGRRIDSSGLPHSKGKT